MARDFDGVDDIITSTVTAVDTGDWTLGGYFNPDTAGEGGFGILLCVQNGTALIQQLDFNDSTRKLFVAQPYSSTNAVAVTNEALAAAGWSACFCTFRASDAKMRAFIGTLSVPMAEATYSSQVAGVGTRTTGATTFNVGNRTAASSTFDGRIFRPFFWGRELSLAEMEAFRLGRQPVQDGSLRVFLPLDSPTGSQAEDLSGNGANGTVTGAVAADNPPIPYTLTPVRQLFVPSAGPTTFDGTAAFLAEGFLTADGELLEVWDGAASFVAEGFLSAAGEHLHVWDGAAAFVAEGFLAASGELVQTWDGDAAFLAEGFLTADGELIPLVPPDPAAPSITLPCPSPQNTHTLGTGEYHVFIEPRGGGSPVAQLPWSQINFGRSLDNTSNCTIQLSINGQNRTECCNAWNEMAALRDEIVVYRDGKVVWSGPLLERQISQNNASISGRDLFFWMDRRFLPINRSFAGVDLSIIFNALMTDALSLDPSPNIQFHSELCGVMGDRSYRADDFIRASDALLELARTGIDFTMIGRHMYAGGLEIAFPEVLQMWEPAKRLATIQEKGLQMATRVTVIGEPPQTLTSSVFSATATGAIDIYGLLELRETEPTIDDIRSLQAAADGRLAMLDTPPIFLNFSCAPEASFTMEDLVPGRQCDTRIRVECQDVEEMMRLQSCAVNVVQSNQGGVSESIDLTLIPVGVESDE